MKSIGILGGMGHRATAHFYNLLLKYAPVVSSERELPPIFISANTTIPSRSAAMSGGQSPILCMEIELRWLSSVASILVCPCNSAHHFIRQINMSQFDARFIDMVELSMSKIIKRSNPIFLGGVVPKQTKIYGDIHYLNHPKIDAIIGAVKHSNVDQSAYWSGLVQDIRREYPGCTIVVGCSELSLVNNQAYWLDKSDMIDTTEELAKETMKQALLGT